MSTDEEAAELYGIYPKKVARAAAMKAIRKALTKEAFEVLQEAVTAYAEARRGEDQQFTPHPATWFNQERWTDDRTTWRNHSKPADPTRVRTDAGSQYDNLV